MTDKQIIIDDQKKTIHRLQDECTEKTNAIIALGEQLKAKEQECDRFKEERDTWHYQWEKRYEICESLSDDIDKLCEQLDQLKAENEELKKEVDDLLHKPEIQDKILWKIDNEALLGSKDAYIYKLEKTLIEIKEIAESYNHYSAHAPVSGYSDILQKISEVEE